MTKIEDIKLIDFLPNYLKNNKDIFSICEGIEYELKNLIINSSKLNLQERLNNKNLNQNEIEDLMWEHHVDYFDKELSMDKKIKLIKDSMPTHLTKGTRFAIESALHTVLDDFFIREWFEYDGDPFTFILLGRTIPSSERLDKAQKIVNSYKRASAHLDPLYGLLYDPNIAFYTKCSNNLSNINLSGTLKTDNVNFRSTLGKKYKYNLNHEIQNTLSDKLFYPSKNKLAKNDLGRKYKYITTSDNKKYTSEKLENTSKNKLVKNDFGVKYKAVLTANNETFNSEEIKITKNDSGQRISHRAYTDLNSYKSKEIKITKNDICTRHKYITNTNLVSLSSKKIKLTKNTAGRKNIQKLISNINFYTINFKKCNPNTKVKEVN